MPDTVFHPGTDHLMPSVRNTSSKLRGSETGQGRGTITPTTGDRDNRNHPRFPNTDPAEHGLTSSTGASPARKFPRQGTASFSKRWLSAGRPRRDHHHSRWVPSILPRSSPAGPSWPDRDRGSTPEEGGSHVQLSGNPPGYRERADMASGLACLRAGGAFRGGRSRWDHRPDRRPINRSSGEAGAHCSSIPDRTSRTHGRPAPRSPRKRRKRRSDPAAARP